MHRAAGLTFDPAAVVARVRRSFHPEGALLVAIGRAHRVEARDGRVALRPRDNPADGAQGRAGVVFETRSVARGDIALATRAVRAYVGDDGGLELEREGLRERWLNDERGAEQSWGFAARPAGRGDLTLRLAVHGARFVSASGDGLRFDSSGTEVRYGVGTWIDARGARFTVRPSYQHGDVVLVVPGEVLDRSAFPAVLDPTVSAEFHLDAPVASTALDESTDSAVAFDGTNYLVTWADSGSAIYGTRVAPSGQILDAAGFVVAPAVSGAGVRSDTAIAATSSGALVVWNDARVMPAGLYGRALGPGGVPAGAAPVLISTSCCASAPAIATDGTNYLVVWSQGDDVFAVRLRPDGTTLDPAPFTIGSTPDPEAHPSVAYHAPNYLVAWDRVPASGLAKVYAMRVNTSGVVLDAAPIRLSGAVESQQYPAVAAGSDGFLVAWGDRRNASNYDLYATRVDPTGAVLDPSGILVAGGSNDQQMPSAAFDGTNYVVAYQTTVNIMGFLARPVSVARVSAAGDVLGTTQASVGGFREIQYGSHVACGGTNCLVGFNYAYERTPTRRTYGVRFDAAGTRLDPLGGVPLATVANTEVLPSVASDGTNFLVTWRDSRGASVAVPDAIWGVRVDPRGTILDPAAIRIAQRARASAGSQSVAFDGTNYLVVWHEIDPLGMTAPSGIFGARVSPAGTLVDAAPIRLFAPSSVNQLGGGPIVGARAGMSLVVWSYAASQTVLAIRVDAMANVLDTTPILLAVSMSSSGSGVPPPLGNVASDGTDFFVTWADRRGGTGQTYGGRVTAAGVAADGTGMRLFATAREQSSGAVTFGAGQYFVALVDSPGVMTGGSLIGMRVSSAGAILDADGIALGLARSASVAFDGANYALVSIDGSAATAQWITPGGAVAVGPFDAAPGGTRATSTVLGANGAGALLMAYSQRFPEVPYRAERVVARVLSSSDGGVLVDAGVDAGADASDSSIPADAASEGGFADATDDVAADAPRDAASGSDVPDDTAMDSARGDDVSSPGTDAGADGLVDSAAANDGAGSEPMGSSPCSCRAPGATPRSTPALAIMGIAIFAARMRARRRRRR